LAIFLSKGVLLTETSPAAVPELELESELEPVVGPTCDGEANTDKDDDDDNDDDADVVCGCDPLLESDCEMVCDEVPGVLASPLFELWLLLLELMD
jgi:hypothetical protein